VAARLLSASLAAVLGACLTTGDKEHAAGSNEPSPASADNVPRSATALNAWLQQRPYASWRTETNAHVSAGPHGGSVRVYLNSPLDDSLTAAMPEHPAGSAAVKELLTNGQVTGWLAMVKTSARSDSGSGWYWYEVTSAVPNAPATAGNGIATCIACHGRGRDFVRIAHPLR
jgi:hypothetical protein